MKIKITEYGTLEILRKDSWKEVVCPFIIEATNTFRSDNIGVPEQSEYKYKRCGDWCPLFGEPETKLFPEKTTVELSICKKTYIIDVVNFEDLR